MATPARPPKPEGISKVPVRQDSSGSGTLPSTAALVTEPQLSIDPAFLQERSKDELRELYGNQELLGALYQARHPLARQHAQVIAEIDQEQAAILSRTRDLATQIETSKKETEEALRTTREWEGKWEEIERQMYSALKPYSTPDLFSRLQSATVESEKTSETLLTSFLEQGQAAQNEGVQDFIKEYRAMRKVHHLRSERLSRWRDGRVSGFR